MIAARQHCIVLTATHGAKAYGMPVARTSRAVASPILLARSGSLINKVDEQMI
jgi:hypothetical protein